MLLLLLDFLRPLLHIRLPLADFLLLLLELFFPLLDELLLLSHIFFLLLQQVGVGGLVVGDIIPFVVLGPAISGNLLLLIFHLGSLFILRLRLCGPVPLLVLIRFDFDLSLLS